MRWSRTRSPGSRRARPTELEELEAEIERRQYAPRTATAMRKRITDRQRRESRRARVDAVLEGITAIESVYRDALAEGSPPLNLDRERLTVNPAEAAKALDACREARAAFEFNPERRSAARATAPAPSGRCRECPSINCPTPPG